MQKLTLDAFILKGPKTLDSSLREIAITKFKEQSKSNIDATLFIDTFYKLWNEQFSHDIVKKEDPFQPGTIIVVAYKDNRKNRSYKIFQLFFQTDLDELFNIF